MQFDLNNSIMHTGTRQTCNVWLVMPSSAISRRRHSVLGLPVRPSVIRC